MKSRSKTPAFHLHRLSLSKNLSLFCLPERILSRRDIPDLISDDDPCRSRGRDLITDVPIRCPGPFRSDEALSCPDRSLQPSQTPVRFRRDLGPGKARFHGFDPRCCFVKPFPYRTISIMVEGVHFFAPKASILHDPVPVFPHRRCSLIHRIQ